jgi:hypothetical protein
LSWRLLGELLDLFSWPKKYWFLLFYFCSPRKELSSPMKLTTTQEQRPRKSWLSGNCSAPLNHHQESNQHPCFPKIPAPNNRWEPTLQLPYKYRVLLEMFKATDTNCAMFFNCKEKITFNVEEEFLWDSFGTVWEIVPWHIPWEVKMRNYGSTTIMVIVLNVEYQEKIPAISSWNTERKCMTSMRNFWRLWRH